MLTQLLAQPIKSCILLMHVDWVAYEGHSPFMARYCHPLTDGKIAIPKHKLSCEYEKQLVLVVQSDCYQMAATRNSVLLLA